MLDEDQPQKNFLRQTWRLRRPTSCYEIPRPDIAQDTSRKEMFAFDPVGNGNGGGAGNIVAHGLRLGM